MIQRSTAKAWIVWGLIAAAAGLYYVKRPVKKKATPEEKIQWTIDLEIEQYVCERIAKEIVRFKETPKTFRRSSIQSIVTDSKISLRYLLKSQGVPEEYPIEHKGSLSKFFMCESEVRQWVDIPSIGGELSRDELILAGLSVTDNLPPSDKPALPLLTSSTKVALVIGNGSYRNRPLKNAKNDSDDMATFLRKSGFEVINVTDASFLEMQDALKMYMDRLPRNQVGLIYYSGHGVEYKGRNYLLPVDVNLFDEKDIPSQAIDASELVDRVSKDEGRVNIVIIDACRSSFVPAKVRSNSQGLVKMQGVRGTIIAFSTAPGQVAEDGSGRNSPYTRNLLKAMAVPGRPIEDVFKETARKVEVETVGRQVPWYNSSILVEFSIL